METGDNANANAEGEGVGELNGDERTIGGGIDWTPLSQLVLKQLSVKNPIWAKSSCLI